jgi:hypothetical protein
VPVTTAGFVRSHFARVEPGIVLVAQLTFRAVVITCPLAGWWQPPVVRLLAALMVGYDVALAWSMVRGTPPPLWVRWLVLVGELTLWAAVHPPAEPYSGMWVLATPLILLTTARHGPAVAGTVTVGLLTWVCGVRWLLQADPFVADSLLYAVINVVGSQCLVALLGTEIRHQRHLTLTRCEAEITAAELSGRNDILTGRGSELIDDLQTTIMRLSLAGVDAAITLRAAMAAHKSELARQTRQRARYVRDAFDLHAQAVRSSQPAVARHVFFDVAPDAAVCVITGPQADALLGSVARHGLTGVVPVRLVGRSAGSALTLLVGDKAHVVAVDRPRVALPLAPAAIVILALLIAGTALCDSTPVPALAAYSLAAITAAYAGWTWRMIRRRGSWLEPWLSLCAVFPFAAATALTTYYAHLGEPRQLTAASLLVGLALVLGTVAAPGRLSLTARAVLVVAVAATVAAAPPGATVRVVSDLVWVPAAYLGAHLLARSLAQFAGQLSEEFVHECGAATDQARRHSQDREMRYLEAVLAQGVDLAASAPVGAVREGVERDLHRISQGLHALRGAVPGGEYARRGG